MPVRLRITLLFTILVMVILGLSFGTIYYFSRVSRERTIKLRLTNRAITTARLLAHREAFNDVIVRRIDSLTTLSLKKKIVQAYDYKNNKIYSYSEVEGDTLEISEDILNDARVNKIHFFKAGDKEAIAYHYSDSIGRIVVVSAAEDVDGKQILHTLFNILSLSFLIGTGLVLMGGYIFSRSLLKPIKKITADVEDISAQNLARRINAGSTRDEWHQLATTLNQLLNRLQESFEIQRRFISNASHELSTPLTSISSQLEVSLQRERTAEEYKKVMQSIHQDVHQMNKLTQVLLEFAKASGNKGGLEIDLIRVDEIVLRLPAEIAKMNPKYSILLAFEELPEDEKKLLLPGNEALMLTAIKNIVINACKYSSDHQATIKLAVKEEKIVITISDKGKGVPHEALKKIFQPFYRVEENITGEGFGLGLSLADRIIKLHKGSIEVNSLLNKGTTFTIIFPKG